MKHDPQQELAALKALLIRGEDGPIHSGAALLRRHPYSVAAVAAVAIGAGLLLVTRPRVARVALALGAWGLRNLMSRSMRSIA